MMKIPNATYPSPSLRYDAAAQVVIFQRVNPDTGQVTFQAPSREAVKEEAQAAAIGADHATHAAAPKTDAVPPAGVAKPAPPAPSGNDKPHVSILI
jgi:hypothetical protein